ncbi:MAG: glycosyltransferase [Candidatus Margulisiibacteriota bacterium]
MLISVIIPVYNRPQFLQEAIESILKQTFKDIEVIVVDDGSTKELRTPNPEPRTKNDKLKSFFRPHKGVSAARNYGVSQASGKYIAFLDSDDLWLPHKLEKQIEFLHNNPEYQVCYTDEKWLRNGEHLNQMKKHAKYHGWIFDKCLPLCIISASSILMERKVFDELGGFDESLPVCEDYDLWLRMALRFPIGYLDDKLITKRGGHPDQLSHQYWGMDRFRIKALTKLLKLPLEPHERELVKQTIKEKATVLAQGAWKRRNYFRWVYYQLKAM